MSNNYLAIDREGKLKFSPHDIVGKSIAILGIRGSGKTNTAAVLAEEILKSNLPVLIIDPDSEYWSLREKFDVLIVGKSQHSDIILNNLSKLDIIGEYSLKNNVSVILDISEYKISETVEGLYRLFESVWSVSFKIRKPYFIILEEAHEFIPQFRSTDLKDVLSRIALRGRKRGLSIILVSQRSAKVDKDVLTQSEILFLHKVTHPADIKVYSEILPLRYNDVLSLVSKLTTGECIVYYNGIMRTVKIRLRETFHPGFTPPPSALKRTKRVEVAYKELMKLLEKTRLPIVSNNYEYLKRKVKELTNENRELRRIIAEKEKEIERLKAKINELMHKINKFSIETGYKVHSAESQAVFSIIRDFELTYLSNKKKYRKVKEYLEILARIYPNEVTCRELAILSGKSVSTIYNSNLKDLVELGIIEKKRVGRRIYLRLNVKNLRKYVNLHSLIKKV